MIRIPVLINFDATQPIGFMEVDETKLPNGTDFCFSIGYFVRAMKNDTVTDFDINCVSVVSDANYAKMLREVGAL